MAEKQTAKRNRREEILQSLALMLESSDGSQRITTAKLAASVGVSEAALYRHFPSKTRMFDSLIEFIEDSLITRINLILKDEKDTTARLRLIVLLILGFGERNPGLTRILTGHALMFEQDRLQGRINQLFERIEAQLRQVLREKKMREGEGYSIERVGPVSTTPPGNALKPRTLRDTLLPLPDGPPSQASLPDTQSDLSG